MSGRFLVIRSDALGSSVEVTASGSDVVVRDLETDGTWSFARSLVAAIDYQGGSGKDQFVTSVAGLPVRVFGYGGDDDLTGGSAADHLNGGEGHDRLDAAGGNDGLVGGVGDDVLLGAAGDDWLWGRDGHDRLVGGAGADRLWGEGGNDVLVTIDGATGDLAQPDAGRDTLWLDLVGTTTDGTFAPAGDRLQSVAGFANGADRTLDGDRIADPAVTSGLTYRRFSNDPLFGPAGPTMNDIRQGSLGDCYLLAGLAAIADDNPQAVRENAVDFGDGTFGVRYGNRFYRVDDDLPVWNSWSVNPAYAGLGAGRSLWVGIYEKAFAHYRTGANSYASIEGGWSVEVNRAFGSTSWGTRQLTGYATATAVANDLDARWSRGEAVTIGFLYARVHGGGNAPLIMSHMYTVARVLRDPSGVVTSIVLRNPWGIDGAGSDGDTSDGLVTVTPAQLLQYVGQVNWGRV